MHLVLGILPEAKLLSDSWEHKIKELASFLPQLVLFQASQSLILLPQLLLRLKVKQ